jgi:hypothetical protein
MKWAAAPETMPNPDPQPQANAEPRANPEPQANAEPQPIAEQQANPEQQPNAEQQPDGQLKPATTSATTNDSPAFGWSAYAERINGRFAMLGFGAVLLIEALSGDNFLHWAGLVP